MKSYLNIQLALICYSCREDILRSSSDLIPVSCSVYPATYLLPHCFTTVSLEKKKKKKSSHHAHLGVCVSMSTVFIKDKCVHAFHICNQIINTQDRNLMSFSSSPVLLSDFSRTIPELNTVHCKGEWQTSTPSVQISTQNTPRDSASLYICFLSECRCKI